MTLVEVHNKKPTDGEVRINLISIQISATERKGKKNPLKGKISSVRFYVMSKASSSFQKALSLIFFVLINYLIALYFAKHPYPASHLKSVFLLMEKKSFIHIHMTC